MKPQRIPLFLTLFLALVLLQGNAIAGVSYVHASTMATSNDHCQQQTMQHHNMAEDKSTCQQPMQAEASDHDNCCQTDCQCQALCLSPMLGTAFTHIIKPFTPVQQHFPATLLPVIKAPVFYRPPIFA